MRTLEESFAVKKYLTLQERVELARRLRLNDTQGMSLKNNLSQNIFNDPFNWKSSEDMVSEQANQMEAQLFALFSLIGTD